MQRVLAGVLLIGSLFTNCAVADGVGITYAQVGSFGLDGSTAGNVVAGPVSGMAQYTLPSTSTFATDGSYEQVGSGYASSTGNGTLRATASEATSCLGSCGSYLVPPSVAGGGVIAPGVVASAWFNTPITVVPGLNTVALQTTFAVTGTTTTTGEMTADAVLFGETCSIDNVFCYAGANNRVFTFQTLAPNGAQSVTVTFGLPSYSNTFEIEYILEVGAIDNLEVGVIDSYLTGTSSGTVDFSHTAQLINIEPVDANGNVTHDGTIIYNLAGTALPGTTPVPEPSAFFGVGAGLSLLARKRMRST